MDRIAGAPTDQQEALGDRPMPEVTDLYCVEADVLGVGDEPADDLRARARMLLDGGARFGPGPVGSRRRTARDLRCGSARRFT
ncbi:hypothetical protein GCM10010464_16710 [Pseudonocardia yunnanensis]|uniref:Uncharacterized protein n=1 Tax=Pseudonocardia yunnanensis TaxID=58107 RepID=A0ABW4EVL0_9PSEU